MIFYKIYYIYILYVKVYLCIFTLHVDGEYNIYIYNISTAPVSK